MLFGCGVLQTPMKFNPKREERKAVFSKIGAAISRRGPTQFNPHYAIQGRAIADSSVSSKTGPKMKSLQWEANGIAKK